MSPILRVFFTFALLTASACGPHYFTIHTGPLVPLPDSITLIDSRPPDSRQSDLLSARGRSCFYAIKRLGDDLVRPTAPEIVSDWLARTAASHEPMHRVEIVRLELHWNLQRRLRAQNASIMLVNACEADSTMPGGVDPVERVGDRDVIVVNLALDVDGSIGSARVAMPMPAGARAPEVTATAAIEAALALAMDTRIRPMGANESTP